MRFPIGKWLSVRYNFYSMKETICLVSLGCHKNLVDSEVILGLLSKEGYSPHHRPFKGGNSHYQYLRFYPGCDKGSDRDHSWPHSL